MKQSKLEFLSTWKCHSMMRADLARPQQLEEVAILDTDWPEIRLDGDLKIWCSADDDTALTQPNPTMARGADGEPDQQGHRPQDSLFKLLNIFKECGAFDVTAASASELLTTTSETIISETRRDIEAAMERASSTGPPLPAVLLRNRPLAGTFVACTGLLDRA